FSFFLFFFQAEDGIRDFHVTGVQTCALPISHAANWNSFDPLALSALPHVTLLELPASAAPSPGGASCVCCVHPEPGAPPVVSTRSEERRVGKECRGRWGPGAAKKEKDAG